LLFLESFLEYCSSRHPAEFPNLPKFDDPEKWQTSREYDIGNGRMDIIIQNPQEGFICVIENKVYASEGDDQLMRYGNWLDKHNREFPYSALCFLTTRGSASLPAGNTPYFRLSYQQDIYDWLEDTLPKIQAQGVNAVVHQYQAIISKF